MILKLSNKWRTPNYARAFSESDKYLFAKVSSTHAFGRVDVEDFTIVIVMVDNVFVYFILMKY